MANDKPINIFVGGGIAGLVGALILSERRPGSSIMLIEREAELGGLLRAFDYGEYGRFDYGMHNIYDLGIAALDELVFGLLPPDDWQISEGNSRDLAGIYFRGKLQTNSPYIDLRSMPAADREKYIAGFFDAASAQPDPRAQACARDVAVGKFGHPITEDLVDPIMRKLYRHPSDQLDPLALSLTALGRVVLFDAPLTAELMKSPFLRARVRLPRAAAIAGRIRSGVENLLPEEVRHSSDCRCPEGSAPREWRKARYRRASCRCRSDAPSDRDRFRRSEWRT